MGQNIDRIEFSEEDYHLFRDRAEQDLAQLRELLTLPGFGTGPASLGAELEVYIVDENGHPLARNTEIRADMQDDQVTLELNRFNLEYNLKPVMLDRTPFSHTEQQMAGALGAMEQYAGQYGGKIVPIGILPTLQLEDFDHRIMTDLPRFHALRNRLREERDGLFRIDISGEDSLSLATDDITLEGANTSFQLHYRVPPADYARVFNTIQLVTPLVLAISANSPLVFGHRLWHESRIPLFKKSIDSRSDEIPESLRWQQPARVNFGHGWLRHGAYELFAEAVRLYPPLLPIVRGGADPLSEDRAPLLSELRMQLGTIWLWNRPVYDPVDSGHLRVEMRSLPSGPTPVDMMASAALMIGLAEGLRDDIDELMTALPFRHATHNFYRAAQQGINASVIWPVLTQSGLREVPVVTLLRTLLPRADEGLSRIGIGAEERSRYLDIIAERLRQQRTGASWQLEALAKLEQKHKRPAALRRMLSLYQDQSRENIPVAQWQLPA